MHEIKFRTTRFDCECKTCCRFRQTYHVPGDLVRSGIFLKRYVSWWSIDDQFGETIETMPHKKLMMIIGNVPVDENRQHKMSDNVVVVICQGRFMIIPKDVLIPIENK